MGWMPPGPGYICEGADLKPQIFCVGVAAAVPFLNLAQINIDAMLHATFGLGPLQLSFQAQLKASLGAQFSWNPQAAIMANAQVGLQLSNLVPKFSVNASVAAALSLKIGGIQILLNLGAALMLQIPPLLLGLGGFLALPGAYYGVYYGPAAGFKSGVQIGALVGGGSIAAVVFAVGTNVMTQETFTSTIGGLFATHA